MPAKLTSDTISARLDAARLAAEEADAALAAARRLVLAGSEDDGPTAAERDAQKALAKANADVERYESLLAEALREDRAAARRQDGAEKDAQDAALTDALDRMETAAKSLATILRAYADTYSDYIAACTAAHELITANPRCGGDSAPPRADELVSTELVRLCFGRTLPPGASTHVAQFFDPSKLAPIATPVASFCAFIKAQLTAAKALRG